MSHTETINAIKSWSVDGFRVTHGSAPIWVLDRASVTGCERFPQRFISIEFNQSNPPMNQSSRIATIGASRPDVRTSRRLVSY